MNQEPKRSTPSFEQEKRGWTWRQVVSKKWFYLVLYLLVAGVAMSVAWWYQHHPTKQVSQDRAIDTSIMTDEEEANVVSYPVSPSSKAEIKRGFYQESSSKKEREAALVQYANTYWPHSGVDFAREDGKSFPVLAALDGRVIRIEENPVIGKQIEIEHDHGLVTVYQSLSDWKVKKGQMVKKGQVIGLAGANHFEKSLGNHLHFEMWKQSKRLNPEQQFLKQNR
jgi:stage II sporulation protein Q